VGADINAECNQYGYALQTATVFRNVEVVQLLLEKGAEVNAAGGYYGYALQAAATATHRQDPWEKEHMTIAQLLLDYGADVNVKGGLYASALRAAREAGDRDMVRLLLENGARD